MVIGSTCQLYKKCRVCEQIKWYKLFESKGKRKRKSYCRECKGKRNELFRLSLHQYKFDTTRLKNEDINVRLKLRSKKRIEYTVSYEQAVLMVNEGVAGIVHETLIYKLYDRKTFKEMILERDENICQYCGRYGDTVDHIKPKSEGGISSPINCVAACRKCNTNKGSLSLERYLFYIEPIEVSENIQDGRLEQHLQYFVHSLKYLNGRILNEGFSEEQALERIYQTLKDVENIVGKLKADILKMGKSELSTIQVKR